MPIHDWTRVGAGIVHAFHHSWVSALNDVLNRELLPDDYYALPERFAADPTPDVLTWPRTAGDGDMSMGDRPVILSQSGADPRFAAPKLAPVAETDMAFYRRKQKHIAVRHVSGDRIVAIIEIVSPGNKSARNPLRAFVQKAAELLDQGLHLLILDLFPPGRRDPEGIHNEIWQEIAGEEYAPPPGKPLTLAAYESAGSIRAYVTNAAVGDAIADMPLFLEPGQAVTAPLELTYSAAFAEVPRRWRRALEAPAA